MKKDIEQLNRDEWYYAEKFGPMDGNRMVGNCH